MDINEIKTLLHHREPYLLVDKVIEINKIQIHTQMNMLNHPITPGHFPGAPIVPGAMLQEMSTQSAGILLTKHYAPVENYHSEQTKGYAIGVLREVKNARYYGMTRPEKIIDIKVDLVDFKRNRFELVSRVYQDEELRAEISFQLVNIPDAML